MSVDPSDLDPESFGKRAARCNVVSGLLGFVAERSQVELSTMYFLWRLSLHCIVFFTNIDTQSIELHSGWGSAMPDEGLQSFFLALDSGATNLSKKA